MSAIPEQAISKLESYAGEGELDTATRITAWQVDDDTTDLLFHLLTTREFTPQELTPAENLVVKVEACPIQEFISAIPSELDSRAENSVGTTLDGVGEVFSSQTGRFRTCRRTSQEMEQLGGTFPARCIEFWPDASSRSEVDGELDLALRETLNQNFSIDPEDYSDYLGTTLLVIEDYRVRITENETEGGLIEDLYDGVELSESELLDIYDDFIIDIDIPSYDGYCLTVRYEEFGELLHQEPIELGPENAVPRETAVQSASNPLGKPTAIRVDDNQGVARYEVPTSTPPGASDFVVSVIADGILLDERSAPLIRSFNLNVNVNPASGPSNQRSPQQPASVFSRPDHTVGQYDWERGLNLGDPIDLDSWVVETASDYDDVMDVISDQLTETVKLVDPYLRPPQLEDLLQRASTDVDLWAITAIYENEMPTHRPDFNSLISQASQAGKDLHILWVPDSPTPLHDRFLLSNGKSLTFGTSLNSLADNLSVVHEIAEEKAIELERNFDFWWTNPRFGNTHDVELIGSTI